MQQYELNGHKLTMVPVPEGVNTITLPLLLMSRYGQSIAFWKGFTWTVRFPVPPGPWRYLCTTSNITEEQAAGLVDDPVTVASHYIFYCNYLTGGPHSYDEDPISALESFHSWLSANNITGNHAILLEEKL